MMANDLCSVSPNMMQPYCCQTWSKLRALNVKAEKMLMQRRRAPEMASPRPGAVYSSSRQSRRLVSVFSTSDVAQQRQYGTYTPTSTTLDLGVKQKCDS